MGHRASLYDERVSSVLYPKKGGAYLRARARLEALMRWHDFTQMQVVDLGCGRGYFALSLAPLAKSVLAVDGDAEKLERAQELAKQFGLQNVDFECAVISRDYITQLAPHNVTLFLAVLHHIINDGSPYVWNEGTVGVEAGRQLLTALMPRTETLFFEMGNVGEMNASPDVWIPDTLLRPAGFQSITVISPPAFTGAKGMIRRVMHYGLPGWIKAGNSSPSRFIQNLTGYDLRDHRFLFLAQPSEVSGS